eukprot:scaffold354905_cov42-Attheya_sp.AAC.2
MEAEAIVANHSATQVQALTGLSLDTKKTGSALPRADSKEDPGERNTQIRDSKLEIRSDEHLSIPDLDASVLGLAPETVQAKIGLGRDTNIIDSCSQGVGAPREEML